MNERGTYLSCFIRVRPRFFCCVRKSFFWSPLHSSFFSGLNNSGEQHVFCYFNGSVMASPFVGGQGTGGRTDTRTNVLLFWLSGLQVAACVSPSRNTSSMAEWADSTSRSMTWIERRPARFFKEAASAKSSGDEFGILADDRCIDTGVFQERNLPHETPPARDPAAAATNQLVRTAARCEAGSPPDRRDFWGRVRT